MAPLSACLLVFHGSRDPRSQKAAMTLTASVQQKAAYSGAVPQALGQVWALQPDVSLLTQDERLGKTPVSEAPLAIADAYLECHPLPLHKQIGQFVDRLSAQPGGIVEGLRLRLVPVFLLPGVHVKEDIPAEVAIAQTALPASITLEITAHLGSCAGVRRLLTERMAGTAMEAWVLLAHGSRRPGANQAIEALAELLGAVPAYWATPPDLATQLHHLQSLGLRKIGIFPYFLFRGGITDAIAQTVTQLTQQFEELTLWLTDPLDASPELTDLLVDLAQRQGA